MKKSRLNYEVEIDECLPQLEDAILNFTLLAAGEIKPDELQGEYLKNLATLNLLKSDLTELKEDYAAEPDGTRNRTEKERELLTENAQMKAEMEQLREWVKELLPENLKEKSKPSKMKVSK